VKLFRVVAETRLSTHHLAGVSYSYQCSAAVLWTQLPPFAPAGDPEPSEVLRSGPTVKRPGNPLGSAIGSSPAVAPPSHGCGDWHQTELGRRKNDFMPQVADIIAAGDFYETAAGGQMIFT
jgi:hypothetical protein